MIRVMLCDDDPFILKLAGQQIENHSREKAGCTVCLCGGEAWNFLRYIQKNRESIWCFWIWTLAQAG